MRRRRAIVALGLVLSAVLGAGAARLRVEVDPDRNLPQQHPYIQALNELHATFGDKNLVIVGLFPNDGSPFEPRFLAAVKRITEGLARLPGTVQPLLQSIASPAMKDVQPTRDGIAVEPLMEAVPTTAEGAAAVRTRVFGNSDNVGTLVSSDGRALAIYATFELSPQLPDYRSLYEAARGVVVANDDGTFTWALSGPVVMSGAVGEYAARMVYFFPIALLVIALVHYDAFRTVQAIFLPLLTALLAVAWAVGMMGWLRVPLDPFNTTTPILILAVAAGHAVQILKRYYEELARLGDNREAVVESIVRVGRVMIAAGTIGALSFLSLLSFGVDTIRTFGIFTALGILSTLAIELTVVPAVRAAMPVPLDRERTRERTTHPWLDRGLESLARAASGSGAAWIVVGMLGVVAMCAFLGRRVEVDTSFRREFAASSPVRLQDDALNRSFAGTSTLVFIIEGPEEGAIARPEALRAIERFERQMEALPGVGKAVSVAGRVKTLHRALAADAAHEGDAAGAPGAPPDELPPTKALAAQYLFLYTLSGGDDLSTLVTPDNRLAKIVVLLHDDSTRYGKQMIAAAEAILARELPPGFHYRVAGSLASNGALTEAMVEGKVANILQITVITIAVGGIVLRSALAGLLVAVPLALAVAINFAVMGFLHIPLDIVTSAVAAMAVGIGADYAVYFLFRLREESQRTGDVPAALRATLLTSGKAIVFVSSAIAAGYSTLCFSGFAFHIQLGGLVALAMLTSSASTLVVLSALASLIARTRFRRALLAPRSTDLDRSPGAA
ncbi:MAG TPA: MMPL family transporter [Burkholderiales bacterium]|nr:MMPL family transporter [Burkholderiales bacterium]